MSDIERLYEKKYWYVVYGATDGTIAFGNFAMSTDGPFDLTEACKLAEQREKKAMIIISWNQIDAYEYNKFSAWTSRVKGEHLRPVTQ